MGLKNIVLSLALGYTAIVGINATYHGASYVQSLHYLSQAVSRVDIDDIAAWQIKSWYHYLKLTNLKFLDPLDIKKSHDQLEDIAKSVVPLKEYPYLEPDTVTPI